MNGHGGIRDTEDQPEGQSYDNMNNYCMVIVNSFNVHNTTMEDCYNNIPVTRSSFTLFFFLNIIWAILLLETSTDYLLTVRVSFLTVAGLAVSCILAIYICGKYQLLLLGY